MTLRIECCLLSSQLLFSSDINHKQPKYNKWLPSYVNYALLQLRIGNTFTKNSITSIVEGLYYIILGDEVTGTRDSFEIIKKKKMMHLSDNSLEKIDD